MGRDESGTVARLRKDRQQRFEPALARHGGRLVKRTGDGALAGFSSAVDARGAAIEFQQSMAAANADNPDDTAIVFRIGLHAPLKRRDLTDTKAWPSWEDSLERHRT